MRHLTQRARVTGHGRTQGTEGTKISLHCCEKVGTLNFFCVYDDVGTLVIKHNIMSVTYYLLESNDKKRIKIKMAGVI